MEQVQFYGVSGHVDFTKSHSRTTNVSVLQFQKGQYVKVATYYTESKSDKKWVQ